ncbi:hypothetical protein PTTG_25412 [Puccinia triticina 1-1 BBBD Race 1]|uniref:Uncharacterized protein n=1 Tax=Puccinia triticina (isolate 1-1 / race 1 (BBBD)) TaxID=630390 RepID=A0A180H3G5_PUCT1|nr:hypothetical protein PTTG_25412 [Puccinia triticina 1-1 BBBD Race 1]
MLLLSSATNTLSNQQTDLQGGYESQGFPSHIPGLEDYSASDAPHVVNNPITQSYAGPQIGKIIHPSEFYAQPSGGPPDHTSRQTGAASYPISGVPVGPGHQVDSNMYTPAPAGLQGSASTGHLQHGSGFPNSEDLEFSQPVKSKAGGGLFARNPRCIIPRRCRAPVRCASQGSCRALARYCWKKANRCRIY